MPDVSAKGPYTNHDIALRHLQSAVGRTMQTVEAEVAGLLNPLQDEGDNRGGTTLAGLFRLLFDRARASRKLVCYGMDWDAEIILRAFYETTAKILRLPDSASLNCRTPDFTSLTVKAVRTIALIEFVASTWPTTTAEFLSLL